MINRMLFSGVTISLALLLAACGADDMESSQAGTPEGSATAAAADLPTTHHPDTAGWDRLFEPGLSDAALSSPDSWTMDNGVLVANDRSTIWSDAAYGDFVLDFEARVPDGTNSGVFFWTADTSDILSALELQMHNPPGDDGEADALHRYGGKNGMAAMYDLKGPSGGTPRPAGEWNRLTITAQDSMVHVVLNGEQALEMNLSDWTEPGMTPDGEEHKFDRAMADQARSGPIGLQGIHSENGVSVEYRNLRIRRLDS
jgi:hypothetical protein